VEAVKFTPDMFNPLNVSPRLVARTFSLPGME